MEPRHSEQQGHRSPGVHLPPPSLFVVAIAIGCGIEAVFPYPLSNLIHIPGRPLIAWACIATGAIVLVWALMTFRWNQTAIYPNRPAQLIVQSGPYRFSRNPMYVALTGINLGVGLLADNLWMLVLLPIVLWLVTVFIIRREEAYLENAFDEHYTDYRNRVRRWL